ncbi:MAG: carboxylate-amine ligase, partial [Planctomycetota bacterium]
MSYVFKGNESHTLGVEIELQLIDRETCALTNRIEEILDRLPSKYARYVKPEFMQSYCEVNTDVCHTVEQVQLDLAAKLHWLVGLGDELGIDFLWGGSHPFSLWEEQSITRGERYAWLMETMQYVARRLVS